MQPQTEAVNQGSADSFGADTRACKHSPFEACRCDQAAASRALTALVRRSEFRVIRRESSSDTRAKR